MLKFITLFILGLFTFSNEVSSNHQSIDDQVASIGPNNFCLFTYGSWVLADEMITDVPTAQVLGPARLPGYRLDFNLYFEPMGGSFPTIVPDCGLEVWGAIYLIPLSDLDTVLGKGGKVDDVTMFDFISVMVDSRYGSLQCSAFQQVDLPEKLIYGLPLPVERRPSQKILDMLTEAYSDTGLPCKYIEEISQLPTTDEAIIETNLTPVQGSQEPLVIKEEKPVNAPVVVEEEKSVPVGTVKEDKPLLSLDVNDKPLLEVKEENNNEEE